jgi:hypothetical protein
MLEMAQWESDWNNKVDRRGAARELVDFGNGFKLAMEEHGDTTVNLTSLQTSLVDSTSLRDTGVGDTNSRKNRML